MSLVEKIRYLANKQGLSLPNLEVKLGLGNGTISRWNKSSPNSDKLIKISDFFGVSIDYLLDRIDENKYYLNGDASKIAQEIFDNDDLKILFNTITNINKNDLHLLCEIARRLTIKENN